MTLIIYQVLHISLYRKCKVLDNDGWNNIVGFEDHFFTDKHNPRIEVVLEEVVQ